MISKDYIMRLIEQLNLVLSRLLFMKDTQDYEQMTKEISESYSKITGVDPEFVTALSTESLINFLTPGGRYEAEKAMIIGRLLYEESLIQKDPFIAAEKKEKALNLLLHTYFSNNEIIFAKENIEIILPGFPVLNADKNTRILLCKYYESRGKYSRTEDILYSLLDDGFEEIRKEIVSFYSRLVLKPEEELINGNLTIEEIKEGLKKVV